MRFRPAMLLSLTLAAIAPAAPITVASAISLREALTEIADRYEKETHRSVQLQFGSSGQLMTQIRNGAPIDIFISAGEVQMRRLLDERLIEPSTCRAIAGNSLVLIVPASSRGDASNWTDLADPRYKRISIGDPATVPVGQYALQTLRSLGLAEKLKGRLIHAANARQVLSYVERNEVEAGIVYSTDALQAGRKVRIIARADSKLHDPIRYPAGVCAHSGQKDAARELLNFLESPEARRILKSGGFELPEPPTTRPAP